MGKGDRMNLYNTSHCMDKTAAEAIQKADRSGYRDKRAMEFISMVHRLAKMAGYRIEERSFSRICRRGRNTDKHELPEQAMGTDAAGDSAPGRLLMQRVQKIRSRREAREVHHILPAEECTGRYARLLYDSRNLISLCSRCHGMMHVRWRKELSEKGFALLKRSGVLDIPPSF